MVFFLSYFQKEHLKIRTEHLCVVFFFVWDDGVGMALP